MKPQLEKPMGPKKYKSTMKKQMLGSLRKYALQLEQELNKVYTDPDTIVGKLAAGYNQMLSANQRLSALCASLLKSQGGRVTMSKDLLESFKGLSVNIKWEVPEGTEKPEDATSYVFSYDTVAAPVAAPVSPENHHEEVPTPVEASASVAEPPPSVDALPTGPSGYTPPSVTEAALETSVSQNSEN